MKQMKIKFRNPDIDTEEVRECIEDNLGTEILEIEETTSADRLNEVKMAKEKPDIIEIDFRCEGDISEEMQGSTDLIEKDITKVLSKYGYNGVEFEWEN